MHNLPEDTPLFETLLKGALGAQAIPAPGEAAMGIGLVGAICHRLMNESAMYDLRQENERLRAELTQQQAQQIAALIAQNQQLMALLAQAGSPEQGRQAEQVLELVRKGGVR